MLISQTSGQVPAAAAPEEDEIRATLEAILAAPVFLRSERQSQFLRFVCETALKGDGAKLNEYVIAHKVFGRGAGYSPGEDSVVRRQAHSLRQKLHDYYARQSGRAQIRIDIPSGRYVPVFTRIEQAAPPPVEKALPPEQPRVVNVTPTRMFGITHSAALAALLLATALMALGYWLGIVTHRNRPPAMDPAVAEIWGPWLADPAGAVICLSNPLTAVVKQFPFALPLDTHGYPPRIVVTPEQSELFRQYFELPAGGHFYLYPAVSQSKTGESLGIATMTAMLTRAGLPVRATLSRFLSWESFRDQNLILLGHDEANRWLDPILDKLPIRMVTTEPEKPRHIQVPAQAGGRPKEFFLERSGVAGHISHDYALVSMISGIDEKHELLLINGINTEGTQIAMEYLCDPKRLRELLTRLRHSAPNHKGAWHLQFVLRTEVRDQVPTSAELVVARVL